MPFDSKGWCIGTPSSSIQHPLEDPGTKYGIFRCQLSRNLIKQQTTIRILSHPDDPPGARIAWRPAPWAWVLREKKTMNRKNRLLRVPWAHKTMKNKGFGHLKTWLFTIKPSKHVGLGGPWYIINIIRPKNGASFWMMMNPYSNHGETRIPTYEKWWLVGLPGKGLKSYPS